MTLRNHFIVTSYLSIVCSVTLICVSSYLLLSGNSRKFAAQAAMEAVEQKNHDVETRLQGLEMTLRDVIYNSSMQQELATKEENRVYLKESVDHAISQASNSLYMLHNLVIFTMDGQMAGSMFESDIERKVQDYSWYEKANQSAGETIWLSDTLRTVRDNYGPHMSITGIKKIRAAYQMDEVRIGEDLGYVCFDVNLDSVLNLGISEDRNQGKTLFVVSKESGLIGSSDRRWIGRNVDWNEFDLSESGKYILLNGKNYLLTAEPTLSSLDWYTVCLTERTWILQTAHTAIGACVGIAVVLLSVFAVLAMFQAEILSRPIKRLQTEFEMVERGEFDIQMKPQTGIVEVDNLFARFHVMAYRLDDLIHKVYDAKIKEEKLIGEARQAQLQSLQMQINPHFLYNTLDSINWMALMEGNEEVSKMIRALGHLFRNSMNTSGIFATVREEMENIQLYLFLEQVRFGGRLEFETDVSEEVMEEKILRHMLQPMVENSIKHGIEPYHIKGTVRIRIHRNEETLTIVVEDNGRGLEEMRLSEIRQMWKTIGEEDFSSKQRRGVGLHNIMKRLWLCYGKRAVFLIESQAGEKTRMEIRIADEKTVK